MWATSAISHSLFKSTINKSTIQRIININKCVVSASFHSFNSSSNPSKSNPLLVRHCSPLSSSRNSSLQCFVRYFSDNANSNSPNNPSTVENIKGRVKTYLIIGGVITGIVIVLNAGLSIIEFFSTLNFLDVGEISFLAGMATAWGLSLVLYLANRSWRISPELVYNEAIKRVLNDNRIKQRLGMEIAAGTFKAYSFIPGAIRWSSSDRLAASRTISIHQQATGQLIQPNSFAYKYLQVYQPKKFQLFFQINNKANSQHAMVSSEVEKSYNGTLIWNLLAVDLLESGDRVVLAGDPDYKIYQGIIKLR
jgi:hypothetical protein